MSDEKSEATHYEELKHPNMEHETDSRKSENERDSGIAQRHYSRKKKHGCAYYFAKLDYEILRPILIYNYEKERMHLQDEAMELLMQD